VVIAETFSSGLADAITDTGMAAYSGTCEGPLVQLACDDDGGVGLFSQITLIGLTPGETIFLRVWEYGGNQAGSFSICTSTIPVCETPDPGATTGPALACPNNSFDLGITNVVTGVPASATSGRAAPMALPIATSQVRRTRRTPHPACQQAVLGTSAW
jgi:hypothetical protein